VDDTQLWGAECMIPRKVPIISLRSRDFTCTKPTVTSFSTLTTEQFVQLGSTQTLQCIAKGEPPPTLQIITASGRQDMAEPEQGQISQQNSIVHTLTVECSDIGTQYCVANNIAGETTSLFNMVVTEEEFDSCTIQSTQAVSQAPNSTYNPLGTGTTVQPVNGTVQPTTGNVSGTIQPGTGSINGSTQVTNISGTIQPTYVSGTDEPTNVSITAQPTNITGTAQPFNITGTAQPTNITGTSQPTITGTSQSNIIGTAQPNNNTVTVQPSNITGTTLSNNITRTGKPTAGIPGTSPISKPGITTTKPKPSIFPSITSTKSTSTVSPTISTKIRPPGGTDRASPTTVQKFAIIFGVVILTVLLVLITAKLIYWSRTAKKDYNVNGDPNKVVYDNTMTDSDKAI